MANTPIKENAGAAVKEKLPSPDIRTAYEIHTLAQLLHAQLPAGAPPCPSTPYGQMPWPVHAAPGLPTSPYGFWPHL